MPPPFSSQSFLLSLPCFLPSSSLSTLPHSFPPPPCPPLRVGVLIWPRLAWIAVYAHLDRAQLVPPLKAECHYCRCLLSVLFARLPERHIFIMLLVLFLPFFHGFNFIRPCMFFIFGIASFYSSLPKWPQLPRGESFNLPPLSFRKCEEIIKQTHKTISTTTPRSCQPFQSRTAKRSWEGDGICAPLSPIKCHRLIKTRKWRVRVAADWKPL